jgi:signal transduction histidine kinase
MTTASTDLVNDERRNALEAERAGRAETLRQLLVAGIVVLLAVLGALSLLRGPGVILWPYVLMLVSHVAAYALLRAGWLEGAVAAHAALYVGTVLLVMLYYGGIRSPAGFVLPPIVLLVGLTWHARAAIVTAAVCSAGLLGIVLLEAGGRLAPRGAPSSLTQWVVATAVLTITSVVLALAQRSIGRARARALEAERHRLEAEARLQRAQRLETVSRLAAGVAHDFNNLLTVVLGQASRIARNADPTASAAARAIEEAAQRAAELTQKLLAIGGRRAFEARELDLAELVRGVEPLLRRSLDGRDRLTLELGAGPLSAFADRASLEQVLVNLVRNAGDATAERGEIVVRAGVAQPAELEELAGWSAPPTGALYFEVADSGVGMSAEVKAHLFEPFFTTKAPGRGTGLGLASVYGIVQQIGGALRVESEPDQGTTVRVFLPESPPS